MFSNKRQSSGKARKALPKARKAVAKHAKLPESTKARAKQVQSMQSSGKAGAKHAKQWQSRCKARKAGAKQGERLPVSGGLSHVVINTILRTI